MNSYDNLMEIMSSRRTAKQYDATKDISVENLNMIFEATNKTPHSMGLDLWRVLNVRRNSKYKKDISNLLQGFNQERGFMASDLSIFITKKNEYFKFDNLELYERAKRTSKFITDSKGVELNEGEVKGFFEYVVNADHGINGHNYSEWAARQAYIACAFMTLSAKSLNIDSTIMEGFKNELNDFLIENNLMNKNERATLIVGLGYTDNIKNAFIGKKQNRFPITKNFKIV